MSRHLFFLLFPFVFCLRQKTLSAQTDTVLALPKVEVWGKKLRGHAHGERSENWDSLALQSFQNGNIGEILEQQSGVFVKNSGPGTLATLSVRGGSAGHTAVTWNGLPIQSPMLGLLDISLLPADLADRVDLRLGGNSSLWGSGAIGGVLSLENKPVFDSPFQINMGATFGSFGRSGQNLKMEYGGKKAGISTTLLHQNSENDFPYKLSNGDEKKQAHAHRGQFDFLQEFYWKINGRNQFAAHFWHQNTDSEIPPTVAQNQSGATQSDQAKRLALHWKRFGNSTVWNGRLGFFTEEIDFRDPLILLKSITHFWSLVGEVEGRFQINPDSRFTLGFTQMLTRAFADAYEHPPTESRTSLFVSHAHYFGKTNTQVTVRQSLVDGGFVGFTPSFSIGHKLSGYFALRAKVSRNYRLPTFNDRFWRPGGNPDLKPERGWSQEIGSIFTRPFGGSQIKYETTIFNRDIHDWILWSPGEGVNYWSAKNLTKVWSRGIEQRLGFDLKTKKTEWNFTIGYDFIRSTNEVALETPKIGAGEQLIYVPKHQAFAGLVFGFGKMKLSYRHRVVGNFAAPNSRLDGHHLGYFRAQWAFAKNPFSGTAFFRTENIWNADYRVIERRPMPGRSFSIGVNLKFVNQSILK